MSDDKFRDVVATWDIALADGKHRIQFEHGTTTGKRVIIVDNVEVIRNNWMFRLVGKESFNVGGKRATIHIEAVSGFQYEYTLEIDGKPLKKFVENRKKTAKVWTFLLDGVEMRMVLGKSPKGLGMWLNEVASVKIIEICYFSIQFHSSLKPCCQVYWAAQPQDKQIRTERCQK